MPTRSFLIVALCALLVPVGVAAAAHKPTMRVAHASVTFGHPIVVQGRHWPARAGCPHRVTIALSSSQQYFVAGHAKLGKTGSWTFRYHQKDLGVGAVHWKLTATERCTHPKQTTSGVAHVSIHG